MRCFFLTFSRDIFYVCKHSIPVNPHCTLVFSDLYSAFPQHSIFIAKGCTVDLEEIYQSVHDDPGLRGLLRPGVMDSPDEGSVLSVSFLIKFLRITFFLG